MLHICDCLVSVTHSVLNICVQFDAEMSRMRLLYAGRNISRIRRCLTAAATKQVIHAFVTSRLAVGNALLYRLPLKQTQRLKKVQNWVARLIEGAMK